ncbi:prephenate dehydrogenase [Oscillospiraceae bacterium MB08-C2-2]|nr:prephenate dehydrogenase [Oscillospiraceae bacterium MB08-C2-2]
MNVAIIGLGLIGGSMAKAIKLNTDHRVFGCDRSQESLEQALESGAVDEDAFGNYGQCDLVLIALFPTDAVTFIKEHREQFKPGSMIIDLCGVKRAVCREVEALFAGTDITFIGGHPMAGRALWGFESSVPDLFLGAAMILTPYPSTPSHLVEKAGDFFRSLGFGKITLTTDEHHDEIIAYTSQLAHILSSAYIQSPTAREFMGFSAGSFRDLTRVAKLNEDMWTQLFLLNRDYLSDQLGVLIENLTAFRHSLDTQDEKTLHEQLRQGRLLKEQLS